jgi:predicted nucleic-acid-binding protein
MKITADTNVLVRALTEDDAEQSKAAQIALRGADVVALTIPVLCELAWVLRSYRISSSDIAGTIRGLLNGTNIVVNRLAAQAGLAVLDAGGDFADGAIAYEGNWLGADTFVSFDKKAVILIKAQGRSALLLSQAS